MRRMPENGISLSGLIDMSDISICPSIDRKRSMIGINPETGISVTENENGQCIIEGPNYALICLAKKIMDEVRE